MCHFSLSEQAADMVDKVGMVDTAGPAAQAVGTVYTADLAVPEQAAGMADTAAPAASEQVVGTANTAGPAAQAVGTAGTAGPAASEQAEGTADTAARKPCPECQMSVGLQYRHFHHNYNYP